MAEPVWNATEAIEGYIMRSVDIRGAKVGAIPRILGLQPWTSEECYGAVYGLPAFTPEVAAVMSIAGFNNDRNPADPESFNRPPLPIGKANAPFSKNPDLLAEMAVLYGQERGMLVKFKLRSTGTVSKDISSRFPIGAGIREYVLHRSTLFRRLWTFRSSERNRTIPDF